MKNLYLNIIKNIKTYCRAALLIAKDKSLPLKSRIFFIAAAAYAFSPIDLVPDFIPLLGYADDIIIIPLLIFLGIKLIPTDIFEKNLSKAQTMQPLKYRSYKGMCFIIAVYVIMAIIVWKIFGDKILALFNSGQ